MSTFFSRDAGLSWVELAQKSWQCTFGDHGGLIVAVPHRHDRNYLMFSSNQGLQWHRRSVHLPAVCCHSSECLQLQGIQVGLLVSIGIPVSTSLRFVLFSQKISREQRAATVGVISGRWCCAKSARCSGCSFRARSVGDAAAGVHRGPHCRCQPSQFCPLSRLLRVFVVLSLSRKLSEPHSCTDSSTIAVLIPAGLCLTLLGAQGWRVRTLSCGIPVAPLSCQTNRQSLGAAQL